MLQRWSRRTALWLMGSGAAATAMGWPLTGRAANSAPLLATQEQIEAEKMLIGLLADPDVKKLQAKIRAELAATPRGQMPDGAARLDEAIAQWTNSLIFGEMTDYRPYPAFLWGTDDTPRTWLGHTLGGVGTSGDNPDAIYRTAAIDGTGRYEVLGRLDRTNPAVQFVFEVDKSDIVKPAEMFAPGAQKPDVQSMVGMFTDKSLKLEPDGSFRITIGGPADGPNHVTTTPGIFAVGIRDLLSDWRQRPATLSIKRLDKTTPEPFDPAELKRRILADLPGYIGFWAKFPDIWMGGLKPNTIATPMQRYGGFGFVTGLRFQLKPDEAAIVTTNPGGAKYTGFQLNDPWMIQPDAKRYQLCLNLSQTKADPDGGFTFVISASDPGTANWLDTTGISDGFGIIRWQAVPPDLTKDGLVRGYKVVKLAELARMPNLIRISPEERRKQLAARAEAYASRTL